MSRICEKCPRRIRRKAKTGPWPRWCAQHKREHEVTLRQTVYRKPRKYTEPTTCADCSAAIEIPEHGKPPQRCSSCTTERKRLQNVERQRRFRARNAS